MSRNTIEKLLEKTRQQESQIERQADTIIALRRKLAHQERANRALEDRLGSQAAQGRNNAEARFHRSAEGLAEGET